MPELSFVDPINPTQDEIRAWAYTPGAIEPTQDWDLILSVSKWDDFYLSLAADPQCPNSIYFLSLLYLIVGDEVRTNYHLRSRKEIDHLLAAAENSVNPRVRRWVERSRALIANPKSYDYRAWAGGGLAREEST